MEKQFINYDLALKLKELGFDEECFGYYNNNHLGVYQNEDYYLSSDSPPDNRIEAPLWQQAFDFLLNKITDEYSLEQSNDIFFISYEGLDILRKIIVKGDRKLCLEKLIEIVENKK